MLSIAVVTTFLDNSNDSKWKGLRIKALKKIAHPVQLLSAVAGCALSLYMVIQHVGLKTGIQSGTSFCSLGKYADCDVVNASPHSELFGIPIASIGALFYFLVFLLSTLIPSTDKDFRWMQRWIGRLALVALAVDIYLLLVQLLALKSVCLLCCLTYVLTFAILLTSIYLLQIGGVSGSWWKILLRQDRTVDSLPRGWVTAAAALASFIGALALLPSAIRLQSQTYAFVESAISQFYTRWSDLPAKKIEASPYNGTWGNPAAKVQIVEFSDFECPHCRRAAFTLHTALKPFQNRVHFVFKNFPLDSSCNTQMQYQLHPHACNLARLAYCAKEKGQFWEFHDRVFLDVDEKEFKGNFDQLSKHLTNVFTPDEIAACLSNPKSLASVQEDIKAANALGIKVTPSLFINGKPINIPITVETLQKLISLEAGLN